MLDKRAGLGSLGVVSSQLRVDGVERILGLELRQVARGVRGSTLAVAVLHPNRHGSIPIPENIALEDEINVRTSH